MKNQPQGAWASRPPTTQGRDGSPQPSQASGAKRRLRRRLRLKNRASRAQAGQLQNKNQPESATNPFIPDSEAVTKTLVEVEEQTPVTTPPTYKIKKLYTQPISVQ